MTTLLPGLWLPSRFRPGGKTYVHLPVDEMRVPVAGLGSAPLISWKSTFTLRGFGDTTAAPAAPSWCEGLIRRHYINTALKYAGAQPLTPLYAEAVDPLDTPLFQSQYNRPFGEGGASSCAMFSRANLWRVGVTDPRFTVPYESRLSYAISDILNLGREYGAYVDYSVNGPQPKPGDILYLSGRPVNGFEHISNLIAIDGDQWHTIDGGQPGVEERMRTMGPDGCFLHDGRELTAFVDISKLPIPCPTGLLAGSIAAVAAGAVVGMFGAAWVMKEVG